MSFKPVTSDFILIFKPIASDVILNLLSNCTGKILINPHLHVIEEHL